MCLGDSVFAADGRKRSGIGPDCYDLLSRQFGCPCALAARPSLTNDIPALHVLLIRDRLKVVWVHAMTHATQMVEMEPRGNRPPYQLERKSMRQHISADHADLAVPMGVQAAAP
jgi:hypothetical protein